MSRFFDLVSKPARDMAELQLPPLPSQSRKIDPAPRLITLDSNENPFGPSPRALHAMQTVLASTHSYPDDDCSELRQKLGAFHEVPLEQVLVAAGSTGLISLLCQTLLAPGLNAVTSERSFIVYGMAVHATGARLMEAPMVGDGLDLDSMLAAIDENTRLVFVANPNNPTGTMVNPDALETFLAEVPGHVVVVLDEAYYEFAAYFAVQRQAVPSQSLAFVSKGATVVVLRTFSKVHGLAGLRVGYGIGPAELMGYCARMQNTFSVSTLAQAAAAAAMDDSKHIDRTVSSNSTQAQVLGVALSDLGIRVVPTWANFLYCEIGPDASEVASQMRARGVRIRPLAAWGAPNFVRISIGTPEQNEVLLNVLRQVLPTRGAVQPR